MIVEWLQPVQQTIGNMHQDDSNQLHNYLHEDDPWKGILSATACAIRCMYLMTLQCFIQFSKLMHRAGLVFDVPFMSIMLVRVG